MPEKAVFMGWYRRWTGSRTGRALCTWPVIPRKLACESGAGAGRQTSCTCMSLEGSMVRSRTVGVLVGLAGLALLASGCVVRAYSTPATATVYTSGSVHTSGAVAVDSSETYTVNNYPPEPLHEEVSVSPGYGYVWIDGYWNW